MDAYHCNITIFVNFSLNIEGLLSLVNILCYSNLIITYAKQHKSPLMEAYHCIITRYLSISIQIRRSIVAC